VETVLDSSRLIEADSLQVDGMTGPTQPLPDSGEISFASKGSGVSLAVCRPIYAHVTRHRALFGAQYVFRNSAARSGMRAACPRSVLQLLAEDLVHHLGTLGERWPDLVAIYQFRRGRSVVPGQQRDALHGNAVGGQD